MCSSVGFSQIPTSTEDKAGVDIRYVEFSQDISPEFREGVKIAFSEQERPSAGLVCDYSLNFMIKTVSDHKYLSYLKEYVSKKSTKKLFIDFGAIII